MEVKSELLNFWEDAPVEGYKAEEADIVKDPLNNVEDALFAFIVTLLY
ncbi:hypothetical protein OXPF_42980 [Oxobacter pfennigii]|uniref:Uncharacterized protein n=1 Tax=Oxobacter pfennigii TaxID=36849 RepID=A0A0P8WJZ7_9CLOT|nr:hypothetical protein [Oxobacter pfennigii]KPU42513.1 hypothetical protein OXPF_42980 [Oxobacter pfennigii]